MKGLAIACFAVLALAVAAVTLAPATLVDRHLSAATSGALRLRDTGGTVWRGHGSLTDAKGTFALPLAWAVDPLPLARGEIAVRLVERPDTEQPGGDIRYRDGAWRIEGLHAAIPAAMLPALAQANARVALGGTIRVELPRLELAKSRYDGKGTLRWNRAALALPMLPPLALGDVEVAVSSRGNGIGGAVSNRGGDVGVTGDLVIDPSRTALDLLLTPAPQAPALLARVLAALGGADGSGTRLRWQGPPLAR
jgi:hypothetical protein